MKTVKTKSLLPSPENLDDISLMYGLNKFFASRRSLVGKPFSVDTYLTHMKNGRVYFLDSREYDIINVYFLNRAMHQVNEACNKLWSTLELHHGMKGKGMLCKRFDAAFLPSSTVPTLHYANISALISILSLFGLCSVVDRSSRRMVFYNLVRTIDGMKLIERNRYLREVFGTVKKGWHAQILQTYEGLLKKGTELSDVNIVECKKLQTERSKFHYDILSQTSMSGNLGVHSYFQFLPVVLNSISCSLDNIHQIIKCIPNRCDKRFKELKKHALLEIEAYNSSQNT